MAAWREVFAAHPGTAAARLAEERYRAAGEALQRLRDREFESVRKAARARAAAGHFVDAIEAVRAEAKDPRLAEVEIAALENQSRAAFNDAVREARKLAREGKAAEAALLFEAPAKGGIPEVAERSRAAIADLRKLAEEGRRAADGRRAEGAHREFREKGAPGILASVRARAYPAALRDLDPAAADPAIRDAVAEEREAVSRAAEFWEGFLKAARARTGQEVSILLRDATRLSGRLVAVRDDRIDLEAPPGISGVPFEKIHADQVVAWTIGKTLPAAEASTPLKAALFFFCEGNDDAARLYLATALERGAAIEAAERVIREGFLRAAAHVPAPRK
jgi:hypothetical protein